MRVPFVHVYTEPLFCSTTGMDMTGSYLQLSECRGIRRTNGWQSGLEYCYINNILGEQSMRELLKAIVHGSDVEQFGHKCLLSEIFSLTAPRSIVGVPLTQPKTIRWTACNTQLAYPRHTSTRYGNPYA